MSTYNNNKIGLDEERRKIIPHRLGDLELMEGISCLPYNNKAIYSKKNGRGEVKFYEHMGYRNRELNNKNIHPSQIDDEDEEVMVQRLSPTYENKLRNQFEL